MRNFKLFTMIFAIMATVCFTACDDKDNKQDTNMCEPACDEATQDCVCAEDKCECKTKDAPVEECFCDEAKTVKCPEGGKDACPDTSAHEDPCKDKAENADCGENKVCQKGEGDKLECKDKPVDPTPAE